MNNVKEPQVVSYEEVLKAFIIATERVEKADNELASAKTDLYNIKNQIATSMIQVERKALMAKVESFEKNETITENVNKDAIVDQ